MSLCEIGKIELEGGGYVLSGCSKIRFLLAGWSKSAISTRVVGTSSSSCRCGGIKVREGC